MIKKAELNGITKNAMGTISFELKIKGMRKFQNFTVYPISRNSKSIKIQSYTRIGLISLNGIGKMSKSHQNGAYFHHLSLDKLTEFKLDKSDWRQIVEYIGLTKGSSVGSLGVTSDNSNAKSIFGLE